MYFIYLFLCIILRGYLCRSVASTVRTVRLSRCVETPLERFIAGHQFIAHNHSREVLFAKSRSMSPGLDRILPLDYFSKTLAPVQAREIGCDVFDGLLMDKILKETSIVCGS